MPNTFALSNPDIENNGPLVGGTDFTVHWTPATSANLPAGDSVQGITWLVDTTGVPTHVCPTAHSDGQFTIPGATINEYKTVAAARGNPTNKAILLRQALVHHLRRLPNDEPTNQRRIDMLSVWCFAQLVDVQ
jgi:hypothetical protein